MRSMTHPEFLAGRVMLRRNAAIDYRTENVCDLCDIS